MEGNILKHLFLTGEYSDMTIIADGVTFHVHQAIICPQSTFFKAAIESGFKESLNRVVNLPEDDPSCIERVLSFMYVNTYSGHKNMLPIDRSNSPQNEEPSNQNTTDEIAVMNELDVYIAADKLQIPALKDFALKRVKRWAKGQLSVDQILEVVSYVVNEIPLGDRELHQAITKMITRNYGGLQDRPEFLSMLQSCQILSSCVGACGAAKVIEWLRCQREAEGDQ